MNRFLPFLFLLLSAAAWSQTASLSVPSKIKAVRVYTQQAEITREATAKLPAGKTELSFPKLSANIVASSIRLNGQGFTILSVRQVFDYEEAPSPEAERQPLLAEQERLFRLRGELSAALSDIAQERAILLKNQQVGGTAGLPAAELRAAMDFFRERLASITQAERDKRRQAEEVEEQLRQLQGKIDALGISEATKYGKVVALVSADKPIEAALTLSYVVTGASWFPSYDIRFEGLSKPLVLSYKANVQQSTGIDWKGVRLSISSGNPTESGQAPGLEPWMLGYGRPARPASSPPSGSVSGRVYDVEDGSPLPGVNVMAQGTSVGTVTDLEGRYSLQLPQSSQALVFMYVGYQTQTHPVQSAQLNVGMQLDMMLMEEVVVSGYGSEGGAPSVRSRKKEREEEDERQVRKSAYAEPAPLPVTSVESQTSFAYDIELPYDIPSDRQSYAVEMVRHALPAEYRYISVPKRLEKAFLTARVAEWGRYNLMEGEANLFFENNFVGKTVLELSQSDTLQLSLGRDERLLVKRVRETDFEERRLVGTRRKETKAWTVELRNNKPEEVELEVLDQIPVPVMEAIKVALERDGGAEHDPATGRLRWRLKLKPNESKKLTFRYTVEYPKDAPVYLE